MTLKEYLDHHRLSLKAFADRCGISAPTVLRVRDGLHMPSRRTLNAIVSATGGQVDIADLIQAVQPSADQTNNNTDTENPTL